MGIQNSYGGYYAFAFDALLEMGEAEYCRYNSDYCYRNFKCDNGLIYGTITNKYKDTHKNYTSVELELLRQAIKDVLDNLYVCGDCTNCDANKTE